MPLAAALALVMAGQENQFPTSPPTLPPSLARGALAACAPSTLEAAERCLRASLSPADLAIVEDRIPARRFRPHLDCEIEIAWQLGNPDSPMGRVMDGLLGAHRPHFAASMIISDLQVRAHGGALLPFDNEVRDAVVRDRPPTEITNCPSLVARPS